MLFLWGITFQIDAEQNFTTNYQLLLYSLQNSFDLHQHQRCCGVALEAAQNFFDLLPTPKMPWSNLETPQFSVQEEKLFFFMSNPHPDILDFIPKKSKITFPDVCLVEEKNLGTALHQFQFVQIQFIRPKKQTLLQPSLSQVDDIQTTYRLVHRCEILVSCKHAPGQCFLISMKRDKIWTGRNFDKHSELHNFL